MKEKKYLQRKGKENGKREDRWKESFRLFVLLKNFDFFFEEMEE